MSTIQLNSKPSVAAQSVATEAPFISVVVPVRNESRCIAGTLSALLGQHYPQDRFEVIVVDGESSDDTWQVVESLMTASNNLRLISNPKKWSSAARNLGVRAARGQFVVVVDGHCDLGSDDYLTEVAAAFQRTGADCLGRPQPLETNKPTPLQETIGLARSSRLGHHPSSFVFSSTEMQVPAHSVAVAYRRSIFDKIGLFDESFDACEDVELNHRIDNAGLRCFLVPKLRVSYHPRASLRGLFRQMMRYGRGRVRLLRKHRDTFSWLGFAPAFFIAAVLLGPLGMLASDVLGWVYAAMLLTYMATVTGFSLAVAAGHRRWSQSALLAIVFLTLHLGAGVGILLEALHCRPRKR